MTWIRRAVRRPAAAPAPAAAPEPPPEVADDDRPQPPDTALLPVDELRLLADLAAGHDPAHNPAGWLLADFLRARFTEAPDIDLARVVLAMVWMTHYAVQCAEGLDEADELLAQLGAAALHLTALERMCAP